MFENLPDKIKKLYQEKIREEEAKQKQNDGAAGSDEGKWKMKFAKTEDVKSKKASNFNLYDSDDEETIRNFTSNAPNQTAAIMNAYSSLMPSTSSKGTEQTIPEMVPAPNPALMNQGPIVLDKFGNFRRVEPQPAPVVVSPQDSRRSRSKGRRSRTRSNSR